MLDSDICTLGVWRVRPDRQVDFTAGWKALGDYFYNLPKSPGDGTLVQSVQNDTLFYSFGPWRSLEDIQAMRGH